MEPIIKLKQEPLDVLVPFVEASVDQLSHLKLEHVGPQSVPGNNQQDYIGRSPIRAELPDVSPDAAAGKHQDFKEELNAVVPFRFKTEPICQEEDGNYVAGSIKEELYIPGPAPGSSCTLENQALIGSVRTVIKQEPVEADPSLLEALDQLISIKGEKICQAQQGDYHDQELFVPGPAAGRHSKSELQEGTGTSVRAAIKWEPMACPSIYDDELIHDGTLDGCDGDTSCSDHNSSQLHHGYDDSRKLQCRELLIWDEPTPCTTTRDQVQRIDGEVTPVVEHEGEQGDQYISKDTQHKPLGSSLGELESFQCDLCKRLFQLKTALRMHISAHTSNKLHQCHVCDKQFSSSSNLITHSRIHSGLKPYQCHICRKQFSQSSNLTSHSRIHSGLKPYQCQICRKQFSQSSALTTHSRIHSPP